MPLHPVQLYESAALFALSGALMWLIHKRKTPPGMVALFYLMGYGVIRFVLEFFRGDNQPIYLGMTISQVTSLLLLAIAIAFAVWRARAGAVPYTPRPASVRT